MANNTNKYKKKILNLKTTNRPCDSDRCSDLGIYPAPKNYLLKEKYYFCLKHIRKYNSSWNFFNKIKENNFNPTWRAEYFEENLYKKYKIKYKNLKFDKISFIKKLFYKKHIALKLFSLDTCACKSLVKYEYRKLAKIYHPDQNSGKKEYEEYFKYINKLYKNLENIS
jgi:hypothetical protein